MGFPSGSDGKESACNAGDSGSIPESGRSPGEGNGYPLQYSCLGNPTDRGAWQATVHGGHTNRKQLKQLKQQHMEQLRPNHIHLNFLLLFYLTEIYVNI